MPSVWPWNGDEGVQKRERRPGCGDLALPSLDIAPRPGDHPQPNETQGQADEIDPKAAAQEHANEPQQGCVRGGTDPDEEQCSVMTGKGLRRSRREGRRRILATQASEMIPIAMTAHGTHRSSPPSQGPMKLSGTTNSRSAPTRTRNTLRRRISPFASTGLALNLITEPTRAIQCRQSPRSDGHQPGSSWVIAPLCFGQNTLQLDRFERSCSAHACQTYGRTGSWDWSAHSDPLRIDTPGLRHVHEQIRVVVA